MGLRSFRADGAEGGLLGLIGIQLPQMADAEDGGGDQEQIGADPGHRGGKAAAVKPNRGTKTWPITVRAAISSTPARMAS